MTTLFTGIAIGLVLVVVVFFVLFALAAVGMPLHTKKGEEKMRVAQEQAIRELAERDVRLEAERQRIRDGRR